MIMVEEGNVEFNNLDKCKSKSVGDRWWEMREEKDEERERKKEKEKKDREGEKEREGGEWVVERRGGDRQLCGNDHCS